MYVKKKKNFESYGSETTEITRITIVYINTIHKIVKLNYQKDLGQRQDRSMTVTKQLREQKTQRVFKIARLALKTITRSADQHN